MSDNTLELPIEMQVVARARTLGWSVYKVKFPGINGAPDRLFGKNRKHYFIEFKRPGKKPGPQQLKRQADLREACGFKVTWTDSYEGACAILGIDP